MSTDSERDPSTDRLLKAALRPRETAGGDACLDAETLAAWADGELYGQDAVGIEAHLADCARCQAMMAALVKSEPTAAVAEPAVARAPIPFRPRQTLRWFVPVAVGTVAATLLVWTAWPRPDATPPAQSAMARMEPPAPSRAPSASDAPVAESTSANRSSVAPKPAAASLPPAVATRAGAPRALPPPMPVSAQPPPPVAGAVTAGLPPPPTPLISPATTGAAASRGTASAGANAGLTLAQKDTATLSQAIEAMEVTFSSPPPQLQGTPAAGAGGGGRGGGGGVRAIAQTAARQVRWLVAASGRVLRSVTDGATWEPVTIDPAATITGGVAPSASVCWLIGRAGAVMLSGDGFTFARVKFPEPADLRSITAVDARQATVTTADGRAFTTTDGGVTWKKDEAGSRFLGQNPGVFLGIWGGFGPEKRLPASSSLHRPFCKIL